MKKNKPIIPVILGPTATGKTKLAAGVAAELNGEIISADSRQVFKGMDIGTGKDLDDYRVGDKFIDAHLIDICEPGTEFSVFDFQKRFFQAFRQITKRGKRPILAGGTGLYLESVLQSYSFVEVPDNPELRRVLDAKNMFQLQERLKQLRPLHNITDITDRQRLIRAIEIAEFSQKNEISRQPPEFFPLVFGIHFAKDVLNKRIKIRLQQRIENGMVGEVKDLLNNGISRDKLLFYGLEYKYTLLLIEKQLTLNQYFEELLRAIQKFAKRQRTWFRRMEKKGIEIIWLNGDLPMERKKDAILKEVLKKTRSVEASPGFNV